MGAAELFGGTACRSEETLNGEILYVLEHVAKTEPPPLYATTPGCGLPAADGNLLPVWCVRQRRRAGGARADVPANDAVWSITTSPSRCASCCRRTPSELSGSSVSASAVLSAPRCGPQLAARPPLPPSLRGASCAAGRGRLTRTHREALPQEPAPGRGGRGRLHGRPRELRQLGGARRVQEQPGLHGGVRRLVPAQLRGLHAREDEGRRREQAPRRPVPAGGRAVPAAAGNPPVTTR